MKKAIMLTDNFSAMFFHWFGDILQKIEALSSAGSDFQDYIILLPYTYNTPYARITMKEYTFDYHFLKPDQLVKVDELAYIPLIAPSGNFRSELMKNMRKRFRIDKKDDNLPPKIFITREHAPNRKILNLNELGPILKKFGYTILSMEKIPFEKQLKYVSSANKLVSLHGAGLTHMLWMEEKSTVLEIRSKDDSHSNCYFSLASDLNLRYHYLLAKKINPKLSTQQSDYEVNAEKFEEALINIE
jgi:capsular polysaccharide biosynthesis protein